MRTLANAQDIVDWRMCIGCGACSYICPSENIELKNYLSVGIRPRVTDTKACANCSDCLKVCPAVETNFNALRATRPTDKFDKHWGPTVGIWEGYASNEEIRYKGSSGGVLTAIAAYCIEKENMSGCLHIGQDENNPILNKTRLSKSREDLMRTVGSRYSPASVCDSLDLVENSHAPCLIIGKPAEISAVRNAMKLRPRLSEKVGLTLSFFCAETPPTEATDSLVKHFGVDPTALTNLRYRGHGWPGYLNTTTLGGESKDHWIYHKSWSYLQSFRPWSVHQWPDGSGELADITCGDPWYESPDGENPGFSLVIARTEKGRKIVEKAIKAGYLTLKPAERWKVTKSQQGLLAKKGSVWGRRIAHRILGLPVTKYKGAYLFNAWIALSLVEKTKSILGTIRRILQRGYLTKLQLKDPAD